ncbi:hypothetical protein ACLMJK_004682 [Lecanora helva]
MSIKRILKLSHLLWGQIDAMMQGADWTRFGDVVFRYIPDSQRLDGGWTSSGSEIESIMNSLQRCLPYVYTNLVPITSRACYSQISILESLEQNRRSVIDSKARDNDATRHVDFEILVPAMLSLLGENGLALEFPGKQHLGDLQGRDLADFDPKILHQRKQISMLHSLEAFSGKIDFGKLEYQSRNCSMLASPSSTAAYLMYSTHWDEDAESYLHYVMADGEGNNGGGVPSAFPPTFFEMIWARKYYLCDSD